MPPVPGDVELEHQQDDLAPHPVVLLRREPDEPRDGEAGVGGLGLADHRLERGAAVPPPHRPVQPLADRAGAAVGRCATRPVRCANAAVKTDSWSGQCSAGRVDEAVTGHPALYPEVASRYTGGNIEGKARKRMMWVGGFDAHRQACAHVAAQGYQGFACRP
ncbi:hypothetical protein [Pseudonocardia abyssalis]|uniref:SPOR domain-containing protein n=1 Tax=Pseudonocardia abyssalis TaxID=2792008 RepID=A0ABS6UXS0_9PSEU|nr:hypothetical protein [Pseudonocardia abyssalis]MBW0114860.1 hypothetical protein [Pseudonocardia abyssalis]MBW0137050.1 hypothetical protein [Pseudonocardia abyssalis]